MLNLRAWEAMGVKQCEALTAALNVAPFQSFDLRSKLQIIMVENWDSKALVDLDDQEDGLSRMHVPTSEVSVTLVSVNKSTV